MLMLLPDPGDHVGDRRGAREGDGLDRQLPLDANHQIRVLLGKQIPYVGVAMVNFFVLLVMALFLFGVPLKGPFLAF